MSPRTFSLFLKTVLSKLPIHNRVVTKDNTYLNKQVAFSYTFVQVCKGYPPLKG